MEYFFDRAESPREVSTHGTLAPITMAAISPHARCDTDLKKTLPDSIFGNSSASTSPATAEPLTFLCSATSLNRATSSERGPSTITLPNCPRSAILASIAPSEDESDVGRTCSEGATQPIFGTSTPSMLATLRRYSICFCFCLMSGCRIIAMSDASNSLW